MYRKILVPLDGSAFSEHALPLALSIAERAGASLHLVHVYMPLAAWGVADGLVMDPGIDKAERERKTDYLVHVSERLRQVSSSALSMAVLDGPRAEALCDAASASRADLVVMTTHGRGPLTRAWLGSVADHVIRCTPVPVLLARPEHGKLDLTQRTTLDKILIPLDGSELAEEIIAPARALGDIMQASYTLLQAIEPMIVPSYEWGGNTLNGLTPEQVDAVKDQASRYLARVAVKLEASSTRVRSRVAFNVPAPNAILDEAEAGHANLIALRTHGRGGWQRLLLGSVADKVIRGATVPVLVSRPQGH